ncbi:MAG: 6-bladed beta-propeller [Ignavibacteria bacterium]|nr:6-bladed beta-propeller [Ignavibacteria bacterium]
MRFIIIIFTICTVIIFFGCKDKPKNTDEQQKGIKEFESIYVSIGKKQKELIFNFERIEKNTKERNWKIVNCKKKFTIGGVDNELLLFPAWVKTDINKNLYVLDLIDCSVKKFDSLGHFKAKYGSKGSGPGEFNNPMHFDVTKDGKKVAVMSPNDNKFAVFESNKISEFKCTYMPHRLRFVSPDEIVVFQHFNPILTSPFLKINYVLDETESYENILSPKSFGGKDYGMLPFLIGNINIYNIKQLVYVSYIMGYVVIYSQNGKIEKTFKLIDEVKASGISKKEIQVQGEDSPMVKYPHPSEYLFDESCVVGDLLYTVKLDFNEDSDSDLALIDVYSLVTGNYMYSLNISGKGKLVSVYFTEDEFYLVKQNTEVEVYKYKIN